MSAKDKQLCEKCFERLATRHICYGHTGETKELCEVCYEETASIDELACDRLIRDGIQHGKCRFCAEPAVGGSGGSIPLLGQQLFLWCEECQKDLIEFAQEPENAFSEEIPVDAATDERLSRLWEDRERRQERFMKERVMKRRSKRHG